MLNADNAKGEWITGFKAFHPFAVKHKNCLYKGLLNKSRLKHHRSLQVSVSAPSRDYLTFRAKRQHFWSIFFCYFYNFGPPKFGHFLVRNNFRVLFLIRRLWPLFGRFLAIYCRLKTTLRLIFQRWYLIFDSPQMAKNMTKDYQNIANKRKNNSLNDQKWPKLSKTKI